MKLSHIDSSIHGGESVTRQLSAAVVDQLRMPGAEIVRRDLAAAPLPHFTLDATADHTIVDEFLSAEGPKGLAPDKRVIIVISRGGFYGAEAPHAAFEHLETYLRNAFGMIEIKPELIVAEGVKVSPEHRTAALQAALQSASQLAPLEAAA